MARGVSKKSVSIKPAYAPVNQADGLRILVDRLWPRGLQKADAHIDHWLHNLAPSNRYENNSGIGPIPGRGFEDEMRLN